MNAPNTQWPADLPAPRRWTPAAVQHTAADCLVDEVHPGQPLVICFGFANWQAAPAFDFFGRTRKVEALCGRPLNRLLLRDPHNLWYQRGVAGLGGNVDQVTDSLRRLVRCIAPSRVITLGQSMGAYAALMWGALLPADQVLAFGPLSSLELGVSQQASDTRWLSVMEKLRDAPQPAARLDLPRLWTETGATPDVCIHYGLADDPTQPDDRNADVFHAQRLASLPRCRTVAHPGSPHTVVQHLKKTGVLDSLLMKEIFDMTKPVASMDNVLLPMPPAPLPPATLDPGWTQWVAENRLRGCTPESMVHTMVQAGVEPALAQDAVATIHTDPCYKAAERFLQLNRKLASVMGNLQRLWESEPGSHLVEKRAGVTQAEFMQRYYAGNRPVVLTDLTTDWPARRRWTPAYLKERFGHERVQIQSNRDSDPDYEVNKLQRSSSIPLGELVDKVTAVGVSNDFYLTANNEALRQPGLAPLLDDIGTLPEMVDPATLATASSLWFGPAGTVTPLHHDTLMLFHTQILGRKRWRFISPLYTPRLYNHIGVFSPINLDRVDLLRHPEFEGVQVLDVVVEPGETVFLPLGWWHQVTSLDVCISFSFSGLSAPNQFTYVNPNILNW
ncbi:MAG: cupin-like domain-containing protein [Pseudomonadota bacterium]